MIFLKDNVQLVSFEGLQLHPIWHEGALDIIEGSFTQFNSPCTITSAWDGKHRIDSLHYKGRGLDFRTREVKKRLRKEMTAEIADMLGNDFDVIFEGNHLHVEFDPK